MPIYDYKCKGCGTEVPDMLVPYRLRDEGPGCPTEGCEQFGQRMERHWLTNRVTAIGDDIPGGVWLENYGPEPIKVYSHTERRALMKNCVDRKGNHYQLEEMVRHVGVPGTDKSPVTTNWNVPSRKMLEDGAELVSRSAGVKSEVAEESEDYNDPEFRDPRINHFEMTGSGAEALEIARIIRGEK